ncbi:hypothetical protein SSPO_037570 [Streptomyces antimycoticus]|uniref:Uncharacterized protein n=1 Tax=Streptomyces antimycoticus TaxID=68175 RepID=A0A499UWA0_9ACTN|nr:hypothetical protein SSPO_037570 [Streptomyces antimycoticus]
MIRVSMVLTPWGRAPAGGNPAGLCEMLSVSIRYLRPEAASLPVRYVPVRAGDDPHTRRPPAPGVGNRVRAVRP